MRHNPDRGIMRDLVESGRIEVSSVLESFEPRQANKIGTGQVVRFGALPYAGAGARKKFIDRG
jgi:hypothetical protein